MQISIDTSRDSKEEIKRVIRLLQEITGDDSGNYQQSSEQSMPNIFESSSAFQNNAPSGMMGFFDSVPAQQEENSQEQSAVSGEESSEEMSETITIAETEDNNEENNPRNFEIPTGQDGEAQKIIESDSIGQFESEKIDEPEEKDIFGNPLSRKENSKPKKFKSGVITY